MNVTEHKSHSGLFVLIVVGLIAVLLLTYVGRQVYLLFGDNYIENQTMPEMAKRLDELVDDSRHLLGNSSIYVYDMTTNKDVFGFNINEALKPASNMKLLTALAAIEMLSSPYRTYSDSLLFDGVIDSQGAATGCLHFKGGYDPLVSSFDDCVQMMAEKGIKSVYGNFVIHLNGINVLSDKGLKPNNIPLLYRSREEIFNSFCASLRRYGIRYYFHDVENAPSNRLTGKMTCLYIVQHSMSNVVIDMLRDSDSGYAEVLIYCMGKNFGISGHDDMSGADELKYMVDYMFPKLSKESYNIVDGTGLSPDNRVCTRLIIDVLKYANTSVSTRNYFTQALPIAGKTGTLKNRMRNTPAANRISAKTGTLYDTPTSALSGYCVASNGHLLAFSIINNGNGMDVAAHEYVADCQHFQDLFCIEMCR